MPTMSALGQKQTCAAHKPMSAKCISGTHAPQQIYNKTWPVLRGPVTIAKFARTALLTSEAVEQPVPAGAAEVALAATTVGPARGMR